MPPRKTIGLTDRQLEVLRLTSWGYTARRVAVALGITEKGVKRHLSLIRQKLGVATTTRAIQIAAEHGWLPKAVFLDPPR